jgi:hypothetical protein
MALINCEECGKEISDKAIVCPHCGAALSSNKQSQSKINSSISNQKIIYYSGIGIIMIVLIATVLIVQGDKATREINEQAKMMAEKNIATDMKIIDYLGQHPEKLDEVNKLLDQEMSSDEIIKILEKNSK